MAAALALYLRTVNYGFSYLDDDALILEQQAFLSHPSSIWRSFARSYFPPGHSDHAYYRPLVTASFAIDAQLSGDRPLGYRATNLILHAVAAGLLYLLLRRFGHREGVAFFGGLVCAAHPALTEAVAWIPGRNDSLLAVWALASWLLLISARAPGRWWLRAGHLVAWLLALFTKEAAILLPVVYLAHARLVERRAWRETVPLWLILGWSAAFAIYLAARTAAVPEGIGIGGLSPAAFSPTLSVVGRSLGKLVLPIHLSTIAVPEDTWIWPGFVALGLWLAAMVIPGIARARLAFALGCLVVFILPSVPASHLIELENRLYLPAIAFVLATAEIAAAMVRGPGRAKPAGVAALVVLILLAARSVVYSGDFSDRMTFAVNAVRNSPHSSLAHRHLGTSFQLAGDIEAARREYERALIEDAGEPVAHNNLAVMLMAQGQLAPAEQHLRQELAINPGYPEAHRNLALILGAAGRDDEAAPHWEASLGLGAADQQALRALVAYYAPRDPVKATQFRARLEGIEHSR